ncbi:amino acid permease, partial [Chitinophaga sp. GbtcB8]|uniref:amino acid permease n=1 Tax=Chitinophaga sp. GbtcB8 TaxID=2824753 RepID=UPI001C2F59EB
AAAEKILYNSSSLIIVAMIMISTFDCNNALILSGARIYYTMAQDGLIFKQAASLNRYSVPKKGMWIQCLWASLLCLS